MKVKAVALVSTLLASSALLAASEPRMLGTVWNSDGQMARIDFVPAFGKTSKINLEDGLELEFTTATDGSSLIRLLNDQGQQLHSARTPAASVYTKSFRYVICGKNIKYSSPEPADIPNCPQE